VTTRPSLGVITPASPNVPTFALSCPGCALLHGCSRPCGLRTSRSGGRRYRGAAILQPLMRHQRAARIVARSAITKRATIHRAYPTRQRTLRGATDKTTTVAVFTRCTIGTGRQGRFAKAGYEVSPRGRAASCIRCEFRRLLLNDRDGEQGPAPTRLRRTNADTPRTGLRRARRSSRQSRQVRQALIATNRR